MSFDPFDDWTKNTEWENDEFDPFADFEKEFAPENPHHIPDDRLVKPLDDYSDILDKVRDKSPQLADSLSKLNNYQLHAVVSDDPKVLLSAMVGSGKTTVLTHKVLYLHYYLGVPFAEMAVLTFTNKAASEIRDRIYQFNQHTSFHASDFRFFGTFHSIARQLLKEHPLLSTLGYTSSFTIMDDVSKSQFHQKVITKHKLDIKYAKKLDKRLDQYYSDGSVLFGNMKKEDDFKSLIELIHSEKVDANLMDFDDLISLAIELLSKKSTFQPKYIVLDEFQDCNTQQVDFLKCLNADVNGIFAVGDPNQSIYAWRGGNASIISDIIADEEYTIMQLPLNYRTSENILNAAAYLLPDANLEMKATRAEGNKIRIVNHFDDQQEVYYYVEKFNELRKDGVDWKEIAILVRTRQQLDIFEQVFSQEGIPFEIEIKRSLQDLPVLYWLHKVMMACVYPDDVDYIMEAFCDKEFGGLKRGKRMMNAFDKFRMSNEYGSALMAFSEFLKVKYDDLNDYIELSENMIGFINYVESNIESYNLYEYFEFDRYLNPTSIHFKKNKHEVENALNQLNVFAFNNYYGSPMQVYKAALGIVNMEGDFFINGTKNTSHSAGVNLMTMHAAKGLEFDYVFLSGANSGIIPLERRGESYDQIKEEKRLLYVALTRARNYMEISWHTECKRWNAIKGPSYFLDVIPKDLLEQSDIAESQEIIWAEGDVVSHPKYGDGYIVECTLTEVCCEFEAYGIKQFMPEMSGLKRR